jgi:histidinol dehydrogenase
MLDRASFLMLRRLDPNAIAWPTSDLQVPDVTAIIDRVRSYGDDGVISIALALGDPLPREISREEIEAAYEATPGPVRAAIHAAAERIERFARAQRSAFQDVAYDIDGFRVGHRAIPVSRVGAYVPAGRYPLPSSLLMTTIPARVAGVDHITVCTPRAAVETLAAAHIAGVDRLFQIGGAQAIAALAYGTESIPRVDLIVGPGNAYVTAAKRAVFGTCGIDMLAGPSEVVVIASSDARASWVAADLLAQAEHDIGARAMLLTDDPAFAEAVDVEISRQVATLETEQTARAALERHGCSAVLPLEDAIAAANALAPEHLELQGTEAEALAGRATTYGSLFVGSHSAEVFADYGIGPNHVLPTSATARFSAGLSVFTFLNVRTFARADGEIEPRLVAETATIAQAEGLDAHRRAALFRT